MHPILNYLAWPVVLGLLVATLTFNFFPEWLDSRFYTSQVTSNEKKNQKKDEKASKPFSYSLAVKKASPSVVNIYTQKKLPSGNRLY